MRRASRYICAGAVLLASGWAFCSLAVGAEMSAGSGAPAASSAAGGLTLEVTDVPLRNVVQLLMRESGMNIILAGSEKMDTPITANLRNLPLETILQSVVASAGVKYVRTDDGTFIIGTDAELLTSNKPAAPTEDVVKPAAPEPVVIEPKRRTRTEKIQLVHINPKQAMTCMGALPVGVALDPNARAGSWTGGSLDVFRGKFGPKVDLYQPANTSLLEPLKPVGATIPPSTTGPAAETSDNPQVAQRSTDPNATFNQYTPGPRGGGYQTGGARGGYGGPTGTGGTGTTGRGGTSTTGTTGSDDLRPDGIDAIIPYEADNSLLVKGEDDAVQELKDLITLVDVPSKQVMIKAEFIEVSTTLSQKLGVDWLLSRPEYMVQTDFRPSGNVLAYVQTGNVTANLRAELTTGGGKLVNSPIISTLNNTAATISIGKQIPFYQSSTQNNGSGVLVTSSSVTYIDASTELNVLPQINGDDTITLILQPRVSDSTGFVTGPNGEQAPQISQETLSTARIVASGETIVVGGFIKKNDSNGKSKVPILGDLPLIGRLFQSGYTSKSDTETLIFITPTIIPLKGAGQTVGVISPK